MRDAADSRILLTQQSGGQHNKLKRRFQAASQIARVGHQQFLVFQALVRAGETLKRSGPLGDAEILMAFIAQHPCAENDRRRAAAAISGFPDFPDFVKFLKALDGRYFYSEVVFGSDAIRL
jgi:hypothetical protein